MLSNVIEPATSPPHDVLAQIQKLRRRITGHRDAHLEAVKKLGYNHAGCDWRGASLASVLRIHWWLKAAASGTQASDF